MNFRFKASSAETTIIYGRKIYRAYIVCMKSRRERKAKEGGRDWARATELSENILQFKMSKFDSELSFIVSIGNVL